MFNDIEQEERLAKRKFAAMRGKEHIPAQLLGLVEAVYRIQTEARAACVMQELPAGELSSVDQVIQGRPLLAREYFPYDAAQAEALFKRFTDLLADLGGPMAQAAAVIRAEGDELMRAAHAAFLSGDLDFFKNFAVRTPQAPRALAFLAQSSMTPSLMAQASVLALALPQDRNWDQATCPICGSLAFHSSLRGKEGVRVHCCSFCRAEYRTFRLQCAYCQERDAAKLPFFTADEEPGYRVDVCESCKGYIKTTDFRELDRPSLPALDDLESLTLDILAMRRGYTRPSASAWGF